MNPFKVLICLVFMTFSLPRAHAANLIPNSSFESGVGRGWIAWGGGGAAPYGNPSMESLLTNDASNGRYSFIVYSGTALQSRVIEVTPGTYTVTFDARGENDVYKYEVLNLDDAAAGQDPRNTFTGDFTWKRYTNTFTATSNGFVVVKFGHIRNVPLLVDAVQFEAGPTATSYAPQSIVEQGITIPSTNSAFWLGDTPKIRLDFWNTGPSTTVVSRYGVYDAWNSNLVSGYVSTLLAAGTNTSTLVSLPTTKGWFRAVTDLPLYFDSKDEATFNVYPFPSNITASASASSLGAHAPAAFNNVRRQILSGRQWNRLLSPVYQGTRWQTVEPIIGGGFVFSDFAFTNFTRDGMSLIAPLTAVDGTWPVGATNSNGYWSENIVSNYCFTLVNRYDVQFGLSNSICWELWNEPFQSGPTGTGPVLAGTNKPINTQVATNYAKLCIAMISGITNANPGANIIIGGGSFGDGSWVFEAWTNMDSASKSHVTIVTTHIYGAIDTGDPNEAYDLFGHFTNAKGWVDTWRGILRVWNDESGVYGPQGAMKGLNQTFPLSFDYYSPFTIEADRSRYMIMPQVNLVRQLTISLDCWGQGFEKLFYYNDNFFNDQSFGAAGIVPYGADYRQVDLPPTVTLSVANYMIAKGFGRIVCAGDANLGAYSCTNSSGNSVVPVWMYNRTNTTLTLSNPDFTAYDCMGNPFQNGLASVPVTRFPIYLVSSTMSLSTFSNVVRTATTSTFADTIPPQLSIDVCPTGPWPGSGTALFRWTAYDNSVTVLGPSNTNTASTATNILTKYRVDASPYSSFSQTNFVRVSGLSSGNHTFTVTAIDRNGNFSEKSVEFSPSTTNGSQLIVSGNLSVGTLSIGP